MEYAVRPREMPLLLPRGTAEDWDFFVDTLHRAAILRTPKFIRVIPFDPRNQIRNIEFKSVKNVRHMCLSNDGEFIAFQLENKQEMFYVYTTSSMKLKGSIPSRRPEVKIIFFAWSGFEKELLVVSDIGLEYLRLSESMIITIKNYGHITRDCIFSSCGPTLVLITGNNGSTLIPFQVRGKERIVKFAKIEIPKNSPVEKDDISVHYLYGKYYLSHCDLVKGEISLYGLVSSGGAPPVLKLKIPIFGPVVLHQYDNLLLVQSIESNMFFIYDIKAAPAPVLDAEKKQSKKHKETARDLDQILAPMPVASFEYNTKENIRTISMEKWRFGYPNIAVDFERGFFFNFELDIGMTESTLSTSQAESTPSHAGSFVESSLFECRTESQDTQPESESLSQIYIYEKVFIPIEDSDSVNKRYLLYVVVDFFRSLIGQEIHVEDFYNSFLIDLLLRNEQYDILQQYLQYHIVDDSEYVANKLLKIGEVHESANQLAFDMFKRLGENRQIVETLLMQSEVMRAIRVIDTAGIEFPVSRIADVLSDSDDQMVYSSVYYYYKSAYPYREEMTQKDLEILEQLRERTRAKPHAERN